MSITDELRKYARGYKLTLNSTYYTLMEIADRIDEEHESACKKERGDGIKIAEEAALEEMGQEYVKLPVDADGVPTHVGDVMVMASHPFGCEDRPLVVDRMELSRGMHGEVWCLALDTDRNCWTQAAVLRHYRAPTVEDMLMDLLSEAEHFCSIEEEREAISAYAAKLRLAGDAE